MMLPSHLTFKHFKALGPFNLGDSLNSVLQLLVNGTFVNEPCKISFNDESQCTRFGSILPNIILDKSSVSIELTSCGIILQFDPEDQSLSTIMWRPNIASMVCRNSWWLKYKFAFDNKHLWEDSESVDCKKVLSAFPPTTLGRYSEESLQYELNFKQGLSFQFGIKDSKTLQILKERQEHPSDIGDIGPPLRMMSIWSREPPICRRNHIEVFPSEGVRLHFRDQRRLFLELGAGIQGVLSSVGLPDSIYQGEIYNYYALGIDIKIPARGCRTISQIIIHTNLPGSPTFGRYDRAWFQVNEKHKKDRDGKGRSVHNLSKLPDIIAALGEPGSPLISEDPALGSRHIYSFPGGIAFEITQVGFIASIHLSNSNA